MKSQLFNKMIGFPTRSGHKPDLVFQAQVSCDYNLDEEDQDKKRSTVVDIATHPSNRIPSWVEEMDILAEVDQDVREEGCYPSHTYLQKKGGSIRGLVEVGTWFEQNSWSDDGYIGIRSTSARLARAVANAIAKVHEPQGGGVPGSHYTPRGVREVSPGVVVYHQSSFGIGD